jgi:hypothetical protein
LFAASVSSDELERWAESLEARSLLPELIWRLLLHAGTYDVLEFPARGGVQSHGWDGVVVATQSEQPVPSGQSGWEVSCRADVEHKANEDYGARQRNGYGLQPAGTAFVFATARRFSAKDRWTDAKKRVSYWRDVRAYDSQNLAIWIADSPVSVAIWLRKAIGLHVHGAEDISHWWETWTNATSPTVPDALVLSGRAAVRSALIGWLKEAPTTLTLRAETVGGATAILAATLQSDSALDRELSRTVIVHSLEAWDQLVYSDACMILVPWFDDTSRTAAAISQGHHVLIPVDHSVSPALADIDAPEWRLNVGHPEIDEFMQALISSRLGDTEPSALNRKGLTVLRRQIALAPASLAPAWASPANGRSLVAPLLAGNWDESNDADTASVGALGGGEYTATLAAVSRWASSADSPIERVGSQWRLRDPRDAWTQLHVQILPNDLAHLESIAVDVLTERDPRFDQPKEERWLANVRGHVPRHSPTLRSGIAQSLAILGSLEVSSVPKNNLTDAQWACRIVRQVLQEADDWQLWASLGSLLGSIAEACPDEFLAALSRATAGADAAARRLFETENGFTFSTSPHSAVVVALEVLAWSPRHFGAVVDTLARLTEIDPGGYNDSGSLDSLAKIFLVWHPNTSVSPTQRLEALDVMRDRHSAVAWDLMQAILPKYMGVALPSATPRWRRWPTMQVEVAGTEVREASRAIIERLVSDAGSDPQKWTELLDQMNHLPFRDQIIAGLEAVDFRATAGDDPRIWHRLRDLIANHRRFPRANWVMPATALDRLEAVAMSIEPTDDVERIGWLFSDKAMIPHDVSSVSGYEAALQSTREDALHSFVQNGDATAQIEQLAESIEEAWHIGTALAGIGYGGDVPGEVLVAMLEASSEVLHQVGRGYIGANVRRESSEWVSTVMQSDQWARLKPESKATVVAALRFTDELWPLLELLDEDTRDRFWKLANVMGNGQLGEEIVERVARSFLAHNLPVKAFNMLALYSHVARPQTIVETLDSVLSLDLDAKQWAGAAHDVVALLERLNTAEDDVGDGIVGGLEWVLLPLISAGGYRPVRLAQAIVRDPELFLQLVALFIGDGTPEGADQLERRGLASRAFDMLQHARAAPGIGPDGSVDDETVHRWVSQVRELASQRGLSSLADNFVGGILQRLPADADGVWPRKAVRDVIEAAESEALESGLRSAVINSRGVTFRAVDAGGELERIESGRFSEWADAFAIAAPRTARLLATLAEEYKVYGSFADDEVRRGF